MLLILVLSLSFAQMSDACPKGSYWNSGDMACRKCDKGSYQSVEGTADKTSTECTPCPDKTTTLIVGATLPRYCIFDCPLGTELNFRNKTCSLCKVGQYKDAHSQVCFYCPPGFTTINAGQHTCTQTLSTPAPPYDVTLVVDLGIKTLPCQNKEHMKIVLSTNVLFMMRRLRRRYPGLCGTDRCDNIRIDVLQVCDSLQQGDVTDASANMTIFNLNSRLAEDGDPTKFRDILQIIDETFYDMTVINDNLLELPNCYYTPGHSLSLDGICELCLPGQFSSRLTYQCEFCPKGTYSSPELNDFCLSCPDGQTTKEVGSALHNECVTDPTTAIDLVIVVPASIGGFIFLVLTIVILVLCIKGMRLSRETRAAHSFGGDGSQNITSSQPKHEHRPRTTAPPNQYTDPTLHIQPASHLPHGRKAGPPQKLGTVYHIPSSDHEWDRESNHGYMGPDLDMDYIIPADYEIPIQEQDPTYEEIM